MLHLGWFERNLDEKNRLAIPKEVRTALEELEPGLTGLHVVPWQGDCLAMFTRRWFAALRDALSEEPYTTDEVLDFQRLLSVGRFCELDSQGRLLLPEYLIKFAELPRALLLTCVFDHLELWDPQRWYGYMRDKKPSLASMAAASLNRIRRRSAGMAGLDKNGHVAPPTAGSFPPSQGTEGAR